MKNVSPLRGKGDGCPSSEGNRSLSHPGSSQKLESRMLRKRARPGSEGDGWKRVVVSIPRQPSTLLLAGYRPLLSLAVCFLHSRCAISESHACGCHSISDRRLDRPYLCERRLLMDNRRNTSFVIVITRLDPVSLAWPLPAASRCSKRLTMRHAPMRSVNAF